MKADTIKNAAICITLRRCKEISSPILIFPVAYRLRANA